MPSDLPTTLLQVIYWLAVAGLAAHFIAYPLVMAVLGWRSLREAHAAGATERLSDEALPSVTVVIAALNEEKEIAARMINLMSQNYPGTKLEVLLGSDGSEDNTVAEARKVADARVQVFDFKERRGKTTVLNELIGQAKGSIIVLSDANTVFDANAIRRLAERFSEEGVGAVCGELLIQDDADSENVDSAYWSIEQLLKRGETRFGVLLGANGAIYAIRRDLYEPLPVDTIVDDFTIVFRIVRDRHRGLYAPEAKAYESSAPDLGGEFRRRVRISQGNFQFLSRYRRDLSKCRPGWRLAFFFHKALRWYSPQLLLSTGIISLLLWDQAFYRLAALGQWSFHALGGALALVPDRSNLPRIVRIIAFINMMLAAILKGWFKFRFTAGGGAWERTER